MGPWGFEPPLHTSVTADASLTHFHPTPKSGLRPHTPTGAGAEGTFHLGSVAAWPCVASLYQNNKK
ncbi:MAG: hypothetical protein FRX49_06221 [Trebouxia sp. A1-2]|nr:MAG: hypothetical protein FRX49_06221 [Trebouxia sp. A1-2]